MTAQPDPGAPVGAGRAHAKAAATEGSVEAPKSGLRARIAAVVAWAKRVVEWWNQSRAGRANARFGAAGGGVLTGGIAYSTLFSVFAGLTIGYTAFMAVLGRDQALRQDVLATVAANLPGLIDTGSENGVLDPDSLRLTVGLNVTSIVAGVVLLVSATSALSSLRTAVRAMFGARTADNAVLGKLRELGAFLGIALAVLLSAVLGIAVTTAADWLLGVLGWSDTSGLVVRAAGVLVAFVVDAAVFVMIVRVLAGQAPARRDLLGGAAIAAAGLGVVRVLGTSVVAGSVQRNPVLASFAVIVVLLLWINLIARIVLLAAAWTANPPAPSPADQVDDDASAASSAASRAA